MKDLIPQKNPVNIWGVVKPLYVVVILKGMKKHKLERNPMNIINVVKPLHNTVIFKGIKEHILERNPINVFSAVKPLQGPVIFKYIKEHILERNPINVINVVKPLHSPVIFMDIKEHILERNPMNVISVIKPLYGQVIFKYIKDHILERNPMNVISVVKPLHGQVFFKYMKDHILEKNPMNVFSAVKPLHVPVIFKHIKEHILERNPINVINVVKLLQVTVIFMDIKEHMLEKNPINAIIVVKPLLITLIFKDMKEHILEKNPMNVINVVNLFHVAVIFMHIKEDMLEIAFARPPTLSGSPVISDISLIRLSPHPAGPGESPFGAHHPYVNPHMEHYLRSVHSSPTLSMISAARGLSPADVAHEHLKERGLFGLAAPAANPSDYYHQMTLMASHPTPYGDLLMQSGGAASAPHLHDYLNPVDASRFSSPRVTPRLSRKRALSISPLSDASLDLQRMIRTSPNSLVAYINNSRSSSAASGSYGHLSAGALSPAFTFPHPINPVAYQQILSQQRGLGSAFGHTPPLIQPSPTFLAQQPMALTSISTMPTQLSSNSSNCLNDANQNKQSSESAVSSTVNPITIHKRSKVKTEDWKFKL
nr:uncharacterized protein LOC121821200 [Peromyscus maniculatus bairdii]